MQLRGTGGCVETVAQAAQIVRERLQSQFKMATLNTMLVLERAADGSEIAEAREAFAAWAKSERLA